MTMWHYAIGQQTYGPVSDDVMRSLATQGVLGPMANVLPAGSASWTPLYVHEAMLGLRRTPEDGYVLASGGAPLAAPVLPGMPPPPPPGFVPMQTASTRLEYSGWWRRVGALILDQLILMVPSLIIVLILISDTLDEIDSEGGFQFNAQLSAFDSGGGIAASLIIIVMTVVYFGFQHGKWGQTIGKRATGIKVVDADSGQLIGMGRSFGRVAFSQVLGAIPLAGSVFTLLDVLWPLWDSKNQALHDKVVRSVVVRSY